MQGVTHMKKKNLALAKETLRQLTTARLADVGGGYVQVTARHGNSCGCDDMYDAGGGGGGKGTTACPQ
jgi:hypothetical protein